MPLPTPTRRLVPWLLLWVLLGVAGPLVLQTGGSTPDDVDERLFHLPTTLQFREQMPLPDLSRYPSATTPLHHLYLATVARFAGADPTSLRWANLAMAALGVAVVGRHLARTTPPLAAVALALPLVLSPYWVGPAARISTDDAALAWVFLAMSALCPPREAADRARFWLAVAATTAAVWTRQLHLWLVPVLALGALFPGFRGEPAQRGGPGRALGAVLPFLTLIPLLWSWESLVPPGFERAHQGGPNPAAVEMTLAVLGLLAPFFAPWWHRELTTGPTAARSRAMALLAAGLAVLLLVGAPLPWRDDPNQVGGAVWALAARSPALGGSQLLLWLLVPLGGATAVVLVLAELRAGTWLVAACLPPWILANAANHRAYHKYYEPFLLFLLAHALSRTPAGPRWWLLGPALLAVIYLLVDLARF